MLVGNPSSDCSLGDPDKAMTDKILQHTVEITNPQGFHMRPKAEFVRIASRFQSNVTVYWEDRKGNGKSILDLMLLPAPQGSRLTVTVDGPDAPDALSALVALLESPPEDSRGS